MPLGYGIIGESIGDDEPPAQAGDLMLGGLAARLALTCGRNQHMCVILDTGGVRCWGFARYGKLGLANGDETIGDNEVVADVPEVRVFE